MMAPGFSALVVMGLLVAVGPLASVRASRDFPGTELESASLGTEKDIAATVNSVFSPASLGWLSGTYRMLAGLNNQKTSYNNPGDKVSGLVKVPVKVVGGGPINKGDTVKGDGDGGSGGTDGSGGSEGGPSKSSYGDDSGGGGGGIGPTVFSKFGNGFKKSLLPFSRGPFYKGNFAKGGGDGGGGSGGTDGSGGSEGGPSKSSYVDDSGGGGIGPTVLPKFGAFKKSLRP